MAKGHFRVGAPTVIERARRRSLAARAEGCQSCEGGATGSPLQPRIVCVCGLIAAGSSIGRRSAGRRLSTSAQLRAADSNGTRPLSVESTSSVVGVFEAPVLIGPAPVRLREAYSKSPNTDGLAETAFRPNRRSLRSSN
uniref:Uncharacterized protein n=1 Tax=Plectus sambesii TaxID=2011161 RepID=A0A914UIE6_9BILA